MTHSINEIRSQLTFGGYRPNQFQVIITNPFSPTADLKTPFMVKASQLPSYNVGQVPVYYFGRPIFVPGDRTWEPWNCTIINDEDFTVKNSLEVWSSKINSLQGNLASTNLVNDLKSTGLITAYSKAGLPLRTYKLNGIWPMSIAAIETDWSSTDAISEYQVTFSFDEATVEASITGTGGDI